MKRSQYESIKKFLQLKASCDFLLMKFSSDSNGYKPAWHAVAECSRMVSYDL